MMIERNGEGRERAKVGTELESRHLWKSRFQKLKLTYAR